MADINYIRRLENTIRQMLQPLRNVPFNLVVEAITGKRVLPFEHSNSEHKEVLEILKKIAKRVGKEINKKGIKRPRPNEVGNDIEKYVKEEMNKIKKEDSKTDVKADTPIGPSGNRKSTGYPDILFWYKDKPYYLECKTYNIENITTTQRSFYLSPSDEFKVIYDAPHFILSYEIYVDG